MENPEFVEFEQNNAIELYIFTLSWRQMTSSLILIMGVYKLEASPSTDHFISKSTTISRQELVARLNTLK